MILLSWLAFSAHRLPDFHQYELHLPRRIGLRSEAALATSQPAPPLLQDPLAIAFFLQGSRGDVKSLKRLIQVLYRPGHFYLIHLDAKAPSAERDEMKAFLDDKGWPGVWLLDPSSR